MKKVCIFNFQPSKEIDNYSFASLNFDSYFMPESGFSLKALKTRWQTFWKKRGILSGVAKIDELYRNRDTQYMAFINDFVDKFQDYDVIVMAAFNPVHPEVLKHRLPKPIKVLGFVDDPYSTYLRGIPYLWAFDGAFYISKSYSNDSLFSDALEKWGCKNHHWWPLVPQTVDLPNIIEDDFFVKRTTDLTYVGLPSADKISRLSALKNHYGDRFSLYGRWPFCGYAGLIKGLLGNDIYWGRVKSLSNQQRTSLYLNTKIGFNMHVSSTPTETGNMRMYEIPAHGIMQLCDKAGLDAHNLIFKDNKEAIYYDDLPDAIEKIDYYLNHEEERVMIAKNGFERVQRDYLWDENLKSLLDWAVSIKR